MALCQLNGRPDICGLGIRIAFYLQWSAVVLVGLIDEDLLPDIRLIGLLLSGALSLTIIILASKESLQPADIYISLLLAMGIYIFLVPLYIWRFFTLCNPYWDALRWSREQQIPLCQYSDFVLLVVVASLGVWYNTTFLPGWKWKCEQYGFFFGRVKLDSKAFVGFNAILYLLIIIICVGILFSKMGCTVCYTKERRRRKIRSSHLATLKALRTVSNIIVLIVLIAAVELTIHFNHINGVNRIDTAAQTIPLLLSMGIFVRVIFFYFASSLDDDSSSSGSYRVSPAMLVAEVDESPQRPPAAHVDHDVDD